MKQLLATIGLWTALMSAAAAKTLTIGVDLSGSNPLLIHPNFAHIAASHVGDQISKLRDGDVINIRSFGARGEAVNLLNQRIVLSRRVTARAVAEALRRYLKSLPEDASVAQGDTNLLAWLEFTSGFDCNNEGSLIVLTDGLESSKLVDARALLAGDVGLPEPQVDLAGCSVTFYGLGAGLPPTPIRHLREEWQSWITKSGAAFTAIIP